MFLLILFLIDKLIDLKYCRGCECLIPVNFGEIEAERDF